MIIGALGKDIIFQTSAHYINTFSDLKWDTKTNLQTIDRHLKNDLIEFCGMDLETISFKMTFNRLFGVDPLESVAKLLKHQRNGDVLMLTIGTHRYGQYRWIIESTSKSLEKFDRMGRAQIIEVDITLKEYAKR